MRTNKHSLSLTPTILECERILREAISHWGLTVKPESIVVTIQTKGRKNALGWFWAARWKDGQEEAVNEINLSAETLRACDPGEVLIHELAHAENNALGNKDCAGRRHNKKFKAMAERLGLVCEAKPAKSVGYGYTKLGEGAKAFLAKAKFDASQFSLNRLEPQTQAKGGTRLLKVECPGCGYVARITRKWLDVGLPVCPCGTEMN